MIFSNRGNDLATMPVSAFYAVFPQITHCRYRSFYSIFLKLEAFLII
jgi:hypothetical protein